MRLKLRYAVCVMAVILFCLLFQTAIHADDGTVKPVTYSEYLESLAQNSSKVPANDVVIPGGRYIRATEGSGISSGSYKGKDNVLIWNSESGAVDYEINITEEGFYRVVFEYFPLEGSNETIRRGFMIDGRYPYEEASRFYLSRSFTIEYPFRFDEKGNNIRPAQNQVFEWKTEEMKDSLGFYPEPLKVYLSKGTHVLTLTGIRSTLALASITLTKPVEAVSYNEYIKQYASAEKYNGPIIIKQAENIYRNSTTYITVENMNEPDVVPEAKGLIIYNAMGGERWREASQWASWEVEVPQDGLYQLSFKYAQASKENLISYRKLEIDDKVLFKEMGSFAFPYNSRWTNNVFGDGKGNPYLIYLTKGKHVIRLTVISDAYREVIRKTFAIAEKIKDIDNSVRKTTGIMNTNELIDTTDKYRLWDIKGTIPDISDRLNECREEIKQQIDRMKSIIGSDRNIYDAYVYADKVLKKFADDPDKIPDKLDVLGQVQLDLIDFAQRLDDEPLMLDCIYLSSPGQKLPAPNAGFFKSLVYLLSNFFKTFSRDYGTVGRSDRDAIEVWVQRNRDYVNLIQETCDQDFTPKTGIKVNVNYIPDNQLLILSNAAGNSPDIASGVSMNIPFDFALRGALVDLSKLPDYKEVNSRFVPGATISFHYDGGDYALPETMTFNMLFYRTDILEELGVEPPKTWEDVRYIIPTLEQNGYKFYYPRGDFLTFYYQNGLDIYAKDGLTLNINNPEGFNVFRQWTELYTVYGMPWEVTSFYQHFRVGDIPIGIVPLQEYLTLMIAAPDIIGKWELAPIPGIRREDSTISIWQGGNVQGIILFKSSKRQQDCWEFMKWWTSDETQAKFANDLESFYGIAFRWFTANRAAFQKIPWSQSELSAIMKQYDWFKEMPYVPGGYFTAREIANAWNRVIIDKKVCREEYEIAMELIEKEMLRKQQEFGFTDINGNVIKPLDVVEVPEPIN